MYQSSSPRSCQASSVRWREQSPALLGYPSWTTMDGGRTARTTKQRRPSCPGQLRHPLTEQRATERPSTTEKQRLQSFAERRPRPLRWRRLGPTPSHSTEARATTGCFKTNNPGALSMESGFRPAAAQLESRQRWLGVRLFGLPQGGQVREIVSAPTAIGRRLTNALAYSSRMERLEESETLDTGQLQRRRPKPRLGQRSHGPDSPCSRMGHDWTAEPPDTRW